MRRPASAVLVAIVLAGCAPHLQNGPRRSEKETSRIEADGVVIAAVDGETCGTCPTVLSGLHLVSLRLSDRHAESAMNDWVQRSSRSFVTVCFVARGGRAYIARPAYGSGRWWPEIIDETTTEVVDTDKYARVYEGCDSASATYSERRRVPVPGLVPILVPVR